MFRSGMQQACRVGREGVLSSWRGMCTEGTGVVGAPKARGNSDFVKRRLKYRVAIHGLRQSLGAGREDGKERVGQIRDEGAARQREVARKQREEAKRKRMMERMARAEKLRQEIAEVKRKRTARKREIWEEREKMLDAKRKGELETLVEASRNWVTEEMLEKEVERVVDEFFVEVERNGDGEGEKVKVVGW